LANAYDPENEARARRAERERLARMALIGGIPNLAITAVAVLSSNSVALLTDLMLSVLDVAAVTVLWLVAWRSLKRSDHDVGYELGKVESLAGLASGVLLTVCFMVVVWTTLPRFTGGGVRVEGAGVSMGIALNVVFAVFNGFVLNRNLRLAAGDPSPLIRAQIRLFTDKLTSNALLIAALLGGVVFGDHAIGRYLDPIAGVLAAVSMAFWAGNVMRNALGELLDAACGEDVQLAVLRALAENFDDYHNLGTIRTRRSGGEVYIDVGLFFAPTTTVAELDALTRRMTDCVRERIRNARLTILPMSAG